VLVDLLLGRKEFCERLEQSVCHIFFNPDETFGSQDIF
jgi:hypothetical protein